VGYRLVMAKLAIPPGGRGAGRLIKRIVVTTVGTALICVGVVLLVLPGPGILMILAGLAVLSTEYDWAKSAFEWVKAKFRRPSKAALPQDAEKL
jgi:uncharacterized protein (TIGR02611 family)